MVPSEPELTLLLSFNKTKQDQRCFFPLTKQSKTNVASFLKQNKARQRTASTPITMQQGTKGLERCPFSGSWKLCCRLGLGFHQLKCAIVIASCSRPWIRYCNKSVLFQHKCPTFQHKCPIVLVRGSTPWVGRKRALPVAPQTDCTTTPFASGAERPQVRLRSLLASGR